MDPFAIKNISFAELLGMTDSHHGQHGLDPYADGHATTHHGGVGLYMMVFVALCLLTGCSFLTYSPLWPWHSTPMVGWVFMMAVSCTKAMLVILFFMHLKWEADWKWVLTVPASIMSLFLLCALIPDIGMRVRRYSEERLENVGTPADTTDLVNASAVQAREHGHGSAAEASHGH
jgi:cytochrome c oxidase subunit 4